MSIQRCEGLLSRLGGEGRAARAVLAITTAMAAPSFAGEVPATATDASFPVGQPSEIIEDESEDAGTAGGLQEIVGNTKLYGYIEAYWEKVGSTPTGVDDAGKTLLATNPSGFDVPNLNVMIQRSVGDHFKGFLNLRAPGATTVDVSNAWVEATMFGQLLAVRAGKLYRPFGLYNEILDAVPTYIGIEPPEMFDKDHLLLTRTTNLMLRSSYTVGEHGVTVALTTGNDERLTEQVPIGADLHYDYGPRLRVGTSFYGSSGDAAPSQRVGSGPPTGAVAAWMASDRFVVYGGYLQAEIFGVLLQMEAWQAAHRARRDPNEVIKLLDANLNARQRQRFGLDGAAPSAADVIERVDYNVRTAYARVGYQLDTAFGAIVPYGQYDIYSNPEIIDAKEFGGDNEAGLNDDGRFHKATIGVVYRPVDAVAVKADASTHLQRYNGQWLAYPELRASLSYLWSL